MPTYVYRCENGHTFELFHSISDESSKRCPECGAEAKRVPAGGAGSGSSSQGAGESKPAKPAGGAASGGSGKPEKA